MSKKICFVTAARSDYGLLKWIMKAVDESPEFELQIIATGGHLMESQGYTITQIEEDGFYVNKKVEVDIDSSSKQKLAKSMGVMAEKMSDAISALNPDYIAVLGDRYELLPICSTAFLMGIPLIHFSGGDVTEGAIDDAVRNAVTMMATYHFPGTEDSRNNIIRMRNSEDNVWCIGEPGLEAFRKEKLMNRKELSESLGLDVHKDWALFTYHSETKCDLQYNLSVVDNCIDLLLREENLQVVATYSNADYGGKEINDYLEKLAKKYGNKLIVIPSLGAKKYLSFMKQVCFVIGNSSSGIVEAPSLKVPVVNIGDRQKGRYLCSNVIQTMGDKESLEKAILKTARLNIEDDYTYWGDGYSSEYFMEVLRRIAK